MTDPLYSWWGTQAWRRTYFLVLLQFTFVLAPANGLATLAISWHVICSVFSTSDVEIIYASNFIFLCIVSFFVFLWSSFVPTYRPQTFEWLHLTIAFLAKAKAKAKAVH